MEIFVWVFFVIFIQILGGIIVAIIMHLNNKKHIEIGAVKYINGVEKEKFHCYVNPEQHIPSSITQINNITDKDVSDAPTIQPALTDFLEFIENYTLIAFNSDFDMSFLQYNSSKKLQRDVKNDVIDALPLAQKYLTNLPNHKLPTIKKYFGLKLGSHNAMDDCTVTNHLYQYCRKYEQNRFKYIIPFTYESTELNDLEIKYLETIIKILEKNGVKKSDMGLQRSSKYLKIFDKSIEKSDFYIKLKLYGKLQYVLLEIPIEKFEIECKTNIKHTAGSSNEFGMTRLFTEDPEQLWGFEKYLVKKQWSNK